MGYIFSVLASVSRVLTNSTSSGRRHLVRFTIQSVILCSVGLYALRVYALHNKHRGILAILAFLIIAQATLNVVRKYCREKRWMAYYPLHEAHQSRSYFSHINRRYPHYRSYQWDQFMHLPLSHHASSRVSKNIHLLRGAVS